MQDKIKIFKGESMKKLLLMVFATSVSLLGGSIIVNENGENGAGIYKVSDNGSEYTLSVVSSFQENL